VYFVTAKHVLQSASDNVQGKVLLRMNTNKGNLEYIKIDLARHVILTHPDVNVDLAATLLYPPQDHFNYLYIPQAYFVDDTLEGDRRNSTMILQELSDHISDLRNTSYSCRLSCEQEKRQIAELHQKKVKLEALVNDFQTVMKNISKS
jgi:hypothetical protein